MNVRHLFAISIIAAGLIWSGEHASASNPAEDGQPTKQDTDVDGSMSSGANSGVFSSTPDPNSPGGAKEVRNDNRGNMEIGKGRQGHETASGQKPSGSSSGVSSVTASSSDSSNGSGPSGSNNSGQKKREQVRDKQVNNSMKDDETKNAKAIKGEVLRVEDDNYFVRDQEGKEVRLHTDKTTEMMGELKKGDRFEAQVNEQNHTMSIRQAPAQ
jgi:hypothetical protein